MADPLAKLRKAPGIVRLHGHRAARGVLPENAMVGFRHLFDTGVRAVEFDVLLTADNIAVITHNPRLLAASTRDLRGNWLDGDGPRISDLTYDELTRYDIGGLRHGTAYAARYPEQAFLSGVAIPRLSELCDLVTQPGMDDIWLNLEIKSVPDSDLTPAPALLAEAVVTEVLGAGLGPRTVVQSFDWRVLAEIEARAPDLPRSHLSYLEKDGMRFDPNIYSGSPWMAGGDVAEHGGSLPRLIAAMGGRVWTPYFEDVIPSEVAEAQALGLVVNTWTVNERTDFDAMIDAGVDGIITDYPARAQRHWLARGLRWSETIPHTVLA